MLPPSLFLNHPDIHVFHGPGAFHFQLGSQTLTVSGFPYAHNVRGAFPELLRQCEPRSNADHHLLCIHHAIEGASVGPSGFTFRDRPDTIRRRDLPAWCNAVLSGHIHRHQTLLGPVPVLYCGSTERTSWAEKEETKGFCELTLKSGDKRVHSRFIPLPTRRMIDFDGRSYDSGPGLVDAVMTAAQDWQPHSLVRIHVDRWPARATSAALACRPFVTTWQCPQAGRSSAS